MHKIICPYCCSRFDPTRMVFRAEAHLQGTEPVEDQKLLRYYIEKEYKNEDDARQSMMDETLGLEAIEIDAANMLGDISDYDPRQLQEYGFVPELVYRGQKLKKRLCPECHKELVNQAGLYEMRIIGLFGDTNAGKTVFLNMLEAVLKGDHRLNGMQGDRPFNGYITFQGKDRQEEESHRDEYNRLVEQGMLPRATETMRRVPPKTFLYKYKTLDRPNLWKNILLVFCDIPGEDTRVQEGLERSGFYLKNVDGILAFMDVARLTRVKPYIRGTENDEGANQEFRAEDALLQLNRFFGTGGAIKIPTAVIATKMDVIRGTDPLLGQLTPEERLTLFPVNTNANMLHVNFLNKWVIDALNRNTKSTLTKLGGDLYCDQVSSVFADYSFFSISALGMTPKYQRRNDEVAEPGGKVAEKLSPFRVAEPFYWLLAKWNMIPLPYEEIYKDRKTERKVAIQLLYYLNEDGERINERLNRKRIERGIRDREGKSNPNWIRIK